LSVGCRFRSGTRVVVLMGGQNLHTWLCEIKEVTMGWTRRPEGRGDNCVQNFGSKRTRKRPLGNGDHRL